MPKVRVKWPVTLTCLLLLCGLLALVAADSRAGPGDPALAQAQQSAPFHGNVSSKIFHRQGYRYYHCRKCVAVFATRNEALQAGYRPCKVCKP